MSGIDGTRVVRRSERLYAALVVVLYPGAFRERYAYEMRLAWRQLCRDVYDRGGTVGLVHAWITELPAFVAGAIWERTAAMARPAAAGRPGNFRAILAINAAALIVFGGALFLAATDMVVAYGLVEASQVPGPNAPAEAWSALLPAKLMAQTLGVALVGLGGLGLATRASVRSRIGTGLPGALTGGHILLAVAFLASVAQYPSVLGWVTVGVSAAFGFVYAAYWFVETNRIDASREHWAATS